MVDYLMSQSATLFTRRDNGTMSLHPDSRWFQRLDSAVRYAVEELPLGEKSGAYIRLDADHRILLRAEIDSLFEALKSN
jgi:hypothetical protein